MPVHLANPDQNPSFTKGIFLGEIREDLLFPYPSMPAQDRESLGMILDSLRSWAKDSVDSAKFDHDGGDQLARRAARHILLLLLLVAEEDDALAPDRLVGTEIDGERGIDRSDFTEDAVVDLGRRAEAAVFLGNAESHHAQRVQA